MLARLVLFALLSIAICSNAVYAWGVAGHQMVGAIAEIHLHDSALSRIKDILPYWAKGHIAPIAAWPDRVRGHYPWSSTLHYITPLDDYPPDKCVFDHGYKSERNVLNAIGNYTTRLVNGRGGDIDFRFLVHFVGDAHQPLHLTGRDRGGNKYPITFDGRHMSLHGLWDTQGLAKNIREMRNYSSPLPSSRIENVLTGSIYDSYIRWILWEGVREWWTNDIEDWLTCNDQETSLNYNNGGSQLTFGSKNNNNRTINDSSRILNCFPEWAEPVQALNCDYVFPKDDNSRQLYKLLQRLAKTSSSSSPASAMSNLPELDNREYWGKVSRDKILESLLAKAGLRLAALLNSIFASPEHLEERGPLNLEWIAESEHVMNSKMWKWFQSSRSWF